MIPPKALVELTRQRAQEGHASFWRQVAEMLALRVFRGVGPGYYHTAGFWRKNISWHDKKSHLSADEYRRRLSVINLASYRKITQNKIPEKAILTLFGIPTPRFLGQIHESTGRDYMGQPLRGSHDLARLVRDRSATRLVFKKPEGWGGKGVRIIDVELSNPPRVRLLNEETYLDLQTFCEEQLCISKGQDWLIEDFLVQHEILTSLNPFSVNTVRIWVLRPEVGEPHTITAYLRIGRGNMFVDNASSGGIVAPIDLASGRLLAAQDPHADRRIYPKHPDHGTSIAGIELPFWPDIQSVAAQALLVFPGLRFAGIDVAVGPTGPVVLELNASPDREAAAFTDCPTVEKLK